MHCIGQTIVARYMMMTTNFGRGPTISRLILPNTSRSFFVNKRQKSTIQLPPPIQNIVPVKVIRILGVIFTNSLSVAEHIQAIINSCAQTLYALRILRSHGMDDVALQTIYHSVVIAKLTYASSAWWGFTSATDRQKLDAFFLTTQPALSFRSAKPAVVY